MSGNRNIAELIKIVSWEDFVLSCLTHETFQAFVRKFSIAGSCTSGSRNGFFLIKISLKCLENKGKTLLIWEATIITSLKYKAHNHALKYKPQTFRDGYVTIEEMIINTKPLQEYCRATPKKMDALATALSVFWGEVGLKPGKKVSWGYAETVEFKLVQVTKCSGPVVNET